MSSTAAFSTAQLNFMLIQAMQLWTSIGSYVNYTVNMLYRFSSSFGCDAKQDIRSEVD